MKRINNLYDSIISMDNLRCADRNAQRGKSNQYGVITHTKQSETNLFLLHEMLLNKTYKTSNYDIFTIYEPKERQVYRLPYFPDRITHHAIMNILEPIFVSRFTADTYSCIKGRGIHSAVNKVKRALKDVPGTKYCLKLDIKKFYPSVDHDILKDLLRRKIKDSDLLWLLDEIIDSADGLPIGNYLSQYFANYYLTYFDYWLKETIGLKYYFRYADDIVIFSDNKPYLHEVLAKISSYLSNELKLEVKGNYQVFLTDSRGVDFLGYVVYHSHTRLRKSIKKNFARMLVKRRNKASIASYMGWAKHANTKHLLKKLLNGNELQRPGNNNNNQSFRRRKNQHKQSAKQTNTHS